METVINALGEIPNIAWQFGRAWAEGPAQYHGELFETVGAERVYNTEMQTDPHDVLVELLGIAMKWQEQKEAEGNGKV